MNDNWNQDNYHLSRSFCRIFFFWAAIEFEIGMWSCVFAAFQTCLMCLLSVRWGHGQQRWRGGNPVGSWKQYQQESKREVVPGDLHVLLGCVNPLLPVQWEAMSWGRIWVFAVAVACSMMLQQGEYFSGDHNQSYSMVCLWNWLIWFFSYSSL